jgi:Uma2 family endonuclease
MTTRTARAIYYPERDGKPMGETPIHRDEIARLIYLLQDHYADRDDVYISGDMMFYYVEGNPHISVCPDVFVTVGVPKLPERRVYKLWEEAVPALVVEVSSRKTRREDLHRKRELYQSLGVQDYVLFDPLAEYLRPPLQGFTLIDGLYQPADQLGASILVRSLGLRLEADGPRIRVFDSRTGDELLDRLERATRSERQARAEAARAEAEASARRALEARVAELEARLQRQQD